MDAKVRIQWLHKRLLLNSYPNGHRLAERFHISPRQAQRDITYLRTKLNAPLEYDKARRGFYYTEDYSLPVLLNSDNDEFSIQNAASATEDDLGTEEAIIQKQNPYFATLEIRNELAATELTPFIVRKEPHCQYVCEFHSIERFLAALLSIEADFKISEPLWLQERLMQNAKRILKNHKSR